MEGLDKRAPFTATGGMIPPEFQNIKTPCYILDEKALIKNAKLLGEVSERTGCKMLLAQKAFSIMTAIDFLSHILQAQRPVDYLRHDLEQRKCREKRFMYSVQATGLMNLKNFFNMRIISCLIHHRSSFVLVQRQK